LQPFSEWLPCFFLHSAAQARRQRQEARHRQPRQLTYRRPRQTPARLQLRSQPRRLPLQQEATRHRRHLYDVIDMENDEENSESAASRAPVTLVELLLASIM